MTMADTSRSLRDELRLETREAHERVDALYGSCDLAKAAIYGRFLTAQAAAWQALMPLLDHGSIERLDGLLADLDMLGIARPAPVMRPDLSGEGTLGMRYVLEGSRLGSTVLLRDLHAKAPDLIERAGRYFTASSNLDSWRSLSTSLQMRSRNDANAAAIINDARSVFDLFERSWWATDHDMMNVRTTS